MLGGLFLEAGTIVGFLTLPTYMSYPYNPAPTYYSVYLGTAAVSGALVLVAAAMMYLRPQLHMAWGIMTLVLSIAGAFGVLAGLFAVFGSIGVAFGVIGGAMAIGWGSAGFGVSVPPAAARMCPGCGRYVPMMLPYCAYCGAPAPTFGPPRSGTGAQPPVP